MTNALWMNDFLKTLNIKINKTILQFVNLIFIYSIA